MSDERGVPGPFPWRPVTRLLASGFVVAGALYVAGLAAGQWLLGGNDDAMRRRIVAEVQASFAALTGDLERAAQAFTAPAPVRAALNEDVPATRALFDRLAQAAGPGSEISLSVYAASGQPLAWAGRPSELPPDRAQDGESWFIIEGALGLRLVYVVAVLEGTTRIGLVSAERELDVSGRGRAAATLQGAPEGYQLETSLAPASLALPFEQTGAADPESFEIVAPSGQRLLSARVSPADLAATRTRWRDALQTITLAALAVWILLLAGPILDWRQTGPNWRERAAATGIIAGLLIGARLVLEIAPASRWSAWLLVTGEAYDSTLAGPFLSSPLDFLLSTFLLGSLVAVLFVAVHGGRARLRRRRTVDHAGALVRYAAAQVLAGAGAAVVLLGHTALLRNTVAQSTVDLLRFSLPPWNSATLALQVGLVAAHAAALGVIALLMLAGLRPWRLRRRWYAHALTIGCWALPILAWNRIAGVDAGAQMPQLAALAAATSVVLFARPLRARYRHGSQAFRLTLLTLGLVVPAVAFYPTMFQLAWQAKSQLIETRYAPVALNQRATVQAQLQESLAQIDQIPGLADLVGAAPAPSADDAPTDRAFQVWQATALARYPVTSSVELYGRDGRLVSRFAFNLPEDLTACAALRGADAAAGTSTRRCRRSSPKSGACCTPAGRSASADRPAAIAGSIVVHAMLDYENLPFISSRTRTSSCCGRPTRCATTGLAGDDVEFAVYGWSRTPLYSSSGTAWPLDDAVFARVEQSRDPVWARLRRGRAGLRRLPAQRPRRHLRARLPGRHRARPPRQPRRAHGPRRADLPAAARRPRGLRRPRHARRATGRALLREIRASFYRKLFLAFVAAVVRAGGAARARHAQLTSPTRCGRTSSRRRCAPRRPRAGRRGSGRAQRAAQQGSGVDDNLMVWVSRA